MIWYDTESVTKLCFVCPMPCKAKAQNVKILHKKRFLDQEGANSEDGRPNGASNPSCLLDWVKGFLSWRRGVGGEVRANSYHFHSLDKISKSRF